jgi:hypothetical protein
MSFETANALMIACIVLWAIARIARIFVEHQEKQKTIAQNNQNG